MGSQAAPVVIVNVSASSGNEHLFHPHMINVTTGTVVSFQFVLCVAHWRLVVVLR
jgi:hypothetical protein